MNTARLSFLALLLVPAVWQDSTKTFDISSESSLYAVRGRLTGTLTLEPGQITVVVKGGSVLAATADTRVELRAVIAGLATDRGGGSR